LMLGYRAEFNKPDMTMHMLELDYALSERWSLMLMPQFMTMPTHNDLTAGNAVHQHMTDRKEGEPADLITAVTWHLPTANGQWQLSAGLGIPTTAKGTVDIKPSLSYTSNHRTWHWGSRIAGSRDLDQPKPHDHEPRSSIELTSWISTSLTPTLSTSLRGVYTHNNNIPGSLMGTDNNTALGLGLTLLLAEQPLSLEWLQPLSSSINESGASYKGSLFIGWHHVF
jgi:hypothetical protein